MADLNLVPEEARKEIKEEVGRKNTANKVALFAIFIAGIIVLGFFLYWLYIVASEKIIASQTRSAEEKILSQSRKEITHRALVEKLDEASKFLSSARPYSLGYEELTKLIGDSKSTMSTSSVDGNGVYSVAGSLRNSTDFGVLIDSLGNSKIFSNPILVSFDGIKDKPYSFNIEMSFTKKGITEATSSAK